MYMYIKYKQKGYSTVLRRVWQKASLFTYVIQSIYQVLMSEGCETRKKKAMLR